MVLVQKWPFFQLFFLGSIGQENIFYDIVEQKNAFLGYKKKKFENPKSDIFRKGLTHGLVEKWPFFQLFFFGNRGQENVFYNIVEKKKPF